MRTSLSRKGSDSGATSGKMPSPILPCGCLCPIPIPYHQSRTTYSDIHFDGISVGRILRDLKSDSIEMTAHLDPDLRKDALLHRPKNWRPAFGQSGAAARHLLNQGFGVGDFFVFFGW